MGLLSESVNQVPEVKFAAGGIVWKEENGVFKIAVIHRPKYDDWTLPKGKPEGDESPGETARREVREELGCKVRFLDFAGTSHRPLDRRRVKLVLFWNMMTDGDQTFQPNDEVDEVLWLVPDQAIKKLSYPGEANLVRQVSPPSGSRH
jgi:8-oxo-dGTP diphosphatase